MVGRRWTGAPPALYAATVLLSLLLPACLGLTKTNVTDAEACGGLGWTLHYVDEDGDGYGDEDSMEQACDVPDGRTVEGGDCDDGDADVHPGADDRYYDGEDTDCAGNDDFDADGDGYTSDEYGGDDCDDEDAAINPGAAEIWYDGDDQNCDGASDYDADGDGYRSSDYGGDDCDDKDAGTYPGAFEGDDTKDNDCDGEIEAGPIAVATYDAGRSRLEICSTVILDGSDSSDPAGLPLSYAWNLDVAPGGSTRLTTDITEETDMSPSFIFDVSGSWQFSLVVTNSSNAASLPSTLTLDVGDRTSNQSPAANAGADQGSGASVVCTPSGYTMVCGTCADGTFNLDATGSTDPDGDGLSYTWAVSSGSATLTTTTGPTTTATVPAPAATYGTTTSTAVDIALTATDCLGGIGTDIVTLTMFCTGT